MYPFCPLLPLGPALPLSPISLNSVANATTATITWVVSSVAYSPEMYIVTYGVTNTDLDSMSEDVEGTQDITVTDVIFVITIGDLHPFRQYYYKIVAQNSLGSTQSGVYSFQTGTLCMWLFICTSVCRVMP